MTWLSIKAARGAGLSRQSFFTQEYGGRATNLAEDDRKGESLTWAVRPEEGLCMAFYKTLPNLFFVLFY